MSAAHDPQVELLTIRLGVPGEPVDLSLLEQLAERLRAAFREIGKEHAGDSKAQVAFLVRDVQKGSIVLSIEPRMQGDDGPSAGSVARQLIDDINALGEQKPRPDMSVNLIGQYRELIRIGERAGHLAIGFDGHAFELGPDNRLEFEAALREQPEPGVEIVGTIETVNIHHRPWSFGLYTKLDRQRVECRFAEPMLEEVLRLMDSQSLVLVKGEARFAVVGITPRTIEITEPPSALKFQPDELLSFRRSADIVREGETAAAAISRIREELAGYG